MSSPGRIVLGVTIAESLKFLGPLPTLLADAGWEVHLVSSPGQEEQSSDQENITFHGISMARKPSLVRDSRSLFLWFRLLTKLNPTIVSIGTPKASLLGIFAAWVLRVPRRIYVLRGLRLETTRGPLRWLLSLLERVTAGCATQILAVSHSLASKYVELGYCSLKKITVLGSGSSHGVDIERFSRKPPQEVEAKRKQLGLASEVPVLGFVGRFSRDKGAKTILATRKKLIENNIDHEILMVGPVEGSMEILDDLNTQGRRIKQVGEVSNVEDFYPLMTMLLLPTKREGFPNVVLESGAAGVPTVTTSVTGSVDSVVHGATGILTAGNSDDEFASAVLDLINRVDKAERLGLAARQWVLENYDSRKVLESIIRFYSSDR